MSTSGRLSPTRFGSYGHRETPTLITKPSLYSLHASVVPNMTEASTFEEMKARIDGLGLEGFSMPPEYVRSPKAEKVYSPSIYSTEWATRPNSVVVTPDLRQMAHHVNNPSSHTKQSSSSGGEIPICYPDLAKDPSFNNITPLLYPNNESGQRLHHSCDHLEVRHPWHGHTHSRDHSNSPRQSLDSTIFAHHVDADLGETYYDSPTSFSRMSATPSPLHYLPATVYTPAACKSEKFVVNENHNGHSSTKKTEAGNGLGIEREELSVASSPSRGNEVFDKAPLLLAQNSRGPSRSPSPQEYCRGGEIQPEVDLDPKKPSPSKSPSSDKLDRMIELLNKINARNNEISSMRDEMRDSNARLDRRLAAVETVNRASPPPPSLISHESSGNEGLAPGSNQNRVPTNVAHDFYRNGQSSEGASSEDDANDGTDDSAAADFDTILGLKETNKRLLEMVGGFAEKLKALEAKVGDQRS